MTTNTSSALLALEQITAVCGDNVSSRADHAAALRFVHEVAAKALRSAATAEPVAWVPLSKDFSDSGSPMWSETMAERELAARRWSGYKLTPLYASPPASGEPQPVVAGELTSESYVADFIANGEKNQFPLPSWEQAYQDKGLIEEAQRRGYIHIGTNVGCDVTVTPHGRTAARLHHVLCENILTLRTLQQGPDEAAIRAQVIEYLAHRGEQPHRVLKNGQELWETHMPAMRAAVRALSHQPAAPAPASDGEVG